MKKWSRRTEKAMINAGWKSGRNVDISNIIHIINAEAEYKINSFFIKFMKEFQGVEIKFFNESGNRDNLKIDFFSANNIEVAENIYEYSSRIEGKKLIPIGSSYNNMFLLLMAEDGGVYAAFDDYFQLISETGYCLFEILLNDISGEITSETE